ncbi:hypothetical protein [Ornithinibacillus bavariensis]|uniref:Uncharacterized protein n=1 Tax=Ornithinibacillus bavariensis TaxID=545502 RepID=A0A919X8W8_9BACI|nr:hypothetical protein [Ornithinibacillus bavariensis]GIO27721.1 hypothetical protein J43TS3_23320 [Ornithinibacillus bavariensis]
MAEISKFFNSAPGDPRKYQSADFADYFGNVLSTGLLHTNELPGMQVSVGTGLNTVVSPGKAIMQGYAYENTTMLTLEHSLPEIMLDRIDRIVLRLDKRNQSRYIKLFVLQGEASENPLPPELTRDEFIYELSLAQIRVRANTSSLQAQDLVDERLNENLCGLVQSLITLPTNQFQEEWDNFFATISLETDNTKSQYEQEWKEWFENQQTEGFVMQDELKGGNIETVTLQYRENVVKANRDTPARLVLLEGRTEIQLVPPFDSSAWFAHNARISVNENDNRKAEVTFQAAYGQTGFGLIPVETGKTYDVHYDFTLPSSATLRFRVSEYSEGDSIPHTQHDVTESSGVFSFTTSSNTTRVSFNLSDDQAYSFSINRLLLAKSGQEPSLVESIQPIRFPAIQVKDEEDNLISQQSIQSYFYEGDRLEWRNGKPFKITNQTEIILNGELDWYHSVGSGDQNGYKVLAVTNMIDTTAYDNANIGCVVKYNGEILNPRGESWTADAIQIGSNNRNLYVSVLNQDSGWGQGYKPTIDEVKAFFNGWRMYDGSSGQSINGVYNRTDGLNKRWAYRDSTGKLINSGTGAILPSLPAPNNSKWQPYRFIYQLGEQSVIPVQFFSELKLNKGVNHIRLSEGMVTREITTPHVMSEFVYLNRLTYPNSLLKNKVFRIIAIYKDGISETIGEDASHNGWYRVFDDDALGNERLTIARKNYDPKAQYTVDYLIMPNNSALTESVKIKYPNNIGSIVDELIEMNTENKEAMQLTNMSLIEDSVIVEEGKNANGSYIRWANGLQMVFRNIPFNVKTTSPQQFDYPARFTEVYGGSWASNSMSTIVMDALKDTVSGAQSSSWIIRTHSVSANSDPNYQSISVNLFAIGRWK